MPKCKSQNFPRVSTDSNAAKAETKLRLMINAMAGHIHTKSYCCPHGNYTVSHIDTLGKNKELYSKSVQMQIKTMIFFRNCQI